jgi:hypothetical protein
MKKSFTFLLEKDGAFDVPSVDDTLETEEDMGTSDTEEEFPEDEEMVTNETLGDLLIDFVNSLPEDSIPEDLKATYDEIKSMLADDTEPEFDEDDFGNDEEMEDSELEDEEMVDDTEEVCDNCEGEGCEECEEKDEEEPEEEVKKESKRVSFRSLL